MENSHNSPKRLKNFENDNIELIFFIALQDKDLLTIQNDFYKFV